MMKGGAAFSAYPEYGQLPGTAFLQLDDPTAHGDGDGLGAVARTQFVHDVLDMNFDGLLRDEEQFGDIAIPVTACDMPENIHLSRSQSLVAHMFCELRGDLRWNALL